MNIHTITVKGVEDKPNKVVILAEEGKYEFFKTGWDKKANGGTGGPGTEPSRPYQQFQAMKIAIGEKLEVDVYEKERSFMGRDNKEVNYTQKTINSFMLGGTPANMNPNGTVKPGVAKTIDEHEEIFS